MTIPHADYIYNRILEIEEIAVVVFPYRTLKTDYAIDFIFYNGYSHRIVTEDSEIHNFDLKLINLLIGL